MSPHVSEWLNAYHDGELRGNRLHHVETHLAECDYCQAELESFERLSSILHEVPALEISSVERFASQVNLRMPYRQITVSRKQILEVGWWMIPVGLLAAWVFFSTAFTVREVMSFAGNLGMLSSITNWAIFGSTSEPVWSAMLGQYGLLSGNTLNWAEAAEVLTRTSLPQISLQASIALLYLSWIAIWWTRRTPQGYGQLLED
jgi:hypothetical protein